MGRYYTSPVEAPSIYDLQTRGEDDMYRQMQQDWMKEGQAANAAYYSRPDAWFQGTPQYDALTKGGGGSGYYGGVEPAGAPEPFIPAVDATNKRLYDEIPMSNIFTRFDMSGPGGSGPMVDQLSHMPQTIQKPKYKPNPEYDVWQERKLQNDPATRRAQIAQKNETTRQQHYDAREKSRQTAALEREGKHTEQELWKKAYDIAKDDPRTGLPPEKGGVDIHKAARAAYDGIRGNLGAAPTTTPATQPSAPDSAWSATPNRDGTVTVERGGQSATITEEEAKRRGLI